MPPVHHAASETAAVRLPAARLCFERKRIFYRPGGCPIRSVEREHEPKFQSGMSAPIPARECRSTLNSVYQNLFTALPMQKALNTDSF